MLTASDTIHGWTPAGDDDVEVNVSHNMCFMTIDPITTSTSFLGSVCPPLDATSPKASPAHMPPRFNSTPLAPLTGVSRTTAPSSDRRAQRNRSRDPSWIPRPRNAFIIFRCEYSREHAQGAQESADADATTSVKTLSKRAAEAWRQLPAIERERYKVLADKEREEHARLYPHYRFRPMKRQWSGTRNRSRERSQSPKEAVEESHHTTSINLPSVLCAAPEKSRSNPSVGRVDVSKPIPTTPLPEPLLYTVDRSQADPEVVFGDYNDPRFLYPSPEPTLPSDSLSSVSIPPDAFLCNDSAFSLDINQEDLERAEALEAYAIGLYQHDLFSPFSFPEYY